MHNTGINKVLSSEMKKIAICYQSVINLVSVFNLLSICYQECPPCSLALPWLTSDPATLCFLYGCPNRSTHYYHHHISTAPTIIGPSYTGPRSLISGWWLYSPQNFLQGDLLFFSQPVSFQGGGGGTPPSSLASVINV